jgi:hypothetical protein
MGRFTQQHDPCRADAIEQRIEVSRAAAERDRCASQEFADGWAAHA